MTTWSLLSSQSFQDPDFPKLNFFPLFGGETLAHAQPSHGTARQAMEQGVLIVIPTGNMISRWFAVLDLSLALLENPLGLDLELTDAVLDF